MTATALLAPGRLTLALLAVLCAGCATTIRPDPERLAMAEAETGAFDHGALDAVLNAHVDDQGRVDYAALVAAPDQLETAYARVAAVSPDSAPDRFPTQADRFAYWINAYNTAVLRCVVDHYPITSVNDVHGPWFFDPQGAGFFYFLEPVFGGEATDLKTLEDEIIRARFTDPRFHFALNCASAGCPKLPAEAFRPESLDAQLERETRAFFAEERNLAWDPATNTVRLSSILDWYAGDFLAWMAAEHPELPPTVIQYAALWAPASIASELRAAIDPTIEFVPYSWALNDQNPVTPPTGD